MADLTKLAGGTVYDPTNGVDGEVLDLWFAGGKMVAPPTDPNVRPSRVIEAAGLVVMPGGVDMHCHIAGPKVNHGRALRADDKQGDPRQSVPRTAVGRSGTLGSVPSTFATGYKYAGLGYTTAMEAAAPPLFARHVHQELEDTPCLDSGCYALAADHPYALRAIEQGDRKRLDAFLAWLLGRAGAYALKIVNPGGAEAWMHSPSGNVAGLDGAIPGLSITPRTILRELTESANRLDLPHPVHIHCNELGMPGNWRTTLESMRSVAGQRAHFTHIQFHSYGGGEADEGTFRSQTPALAEYVNAHPEVTVDVGQVLFGPTTSMTGDSPLGYFLHKVTGGRWVSADAELEGGCGVSPIHYKNKNLVHALQWAIGLEWYLLVDDPWRVAMSTDHPNGAAFLAYPEIVRLLMDRTYRNDLLATCPARTRERSVLADLDRQYTMGEIAIITRAGPARMLGLTHKGHLGPGADADITVYTPDPNQATMFQLPRMVFKGGVLVCEQGELRAAPRGQRLTVGRDYDPAPLGDLPEFFERHASIPVEQYGLGEGANPSEPPFAFT